MPREHSRSTPSNPNDRDAVSGRTTPPPSRAERHPLLTVGTKAGTSAAGDPAPAATGLAFSLPVMLTILRAFRPLQWSKNAIIFAALVFDQKLFDTAALATSLAAVVMFCALSSGVYLVNDLRDAAADRRHPVKRFRPIASGALAPKLALLTAAVLITGGLMLGWLIRPGLGLIGIGYVALMIVYSLGLKKMVILDVLAIATGFVLRAVAGAVAIAVTISPWLLVCTMLLALLLGFGKRRSELVALPDAVGHRANLESYSPPLLDQLIGVVSSATVMAYAFYTFDAAAVPQNHAMMLTIPFVVYAIFRYLFLLHHGDRAGTPEALLFTDRPLLLTIAAWGATSIAILYLAT